MSFLRHVRSEKPLGVWLILLAVHLTSNAATLSDPGVDAYNVRAATETFAGLYKFTTNTLLVETAEAMTNMGSDIIKFYMGNNASYQSGITLPGSVTNLLTLARDEPSYNQVLSMPFRHFIIWAYPFANSDSWWANGYNTTKGTNDYQEMYALTRYLLTNYNNSGKTFYLGHWEGDGYLSVVVNGKPWATNPAPGTIQGMIGWLNNRQQAVDDAKAATPHTNVNVFNYAEANRVRDAMLNGPTNNQRVINCVIPYVTNLDYLSYSSYDAQDLSASDLYATLNYMQSQIPTNKSATAPGERMWIGEYGWGYDSPLAQEPLTRAYIQRLLGWSFEGQCLQYILFWEIYNNQTPAAGGTNYYLIDPQDNRTPCYHLHEYFINQAKLLTAQFKEINGVLPTDTQFSSLVAPVLNAPLTAPSNLLLTNLSASLVDAGTAVVSTTFAQGVYGDDEASIWLAWGTNNGGQNPAAWQNLQFLRINTNFNPTVINATITNLSPGASYSIAFFASNANAQAWATLAPSLSTAALPTTNYAWRQKISFQGYTGSQALAHFPALILFSNGTPGFSYSQFASSSGGDLRFTDAGGLTPLPFEINQWNPNGVSSVWVQIPALNNDASIWAYWGNPADANPPASTTNGSVWQPAYQLVWHLEQSKFPYTDSAGTHPAVAGIAPAPGPGAIGSGAVFNGSSSWLDARPINVGNVFTLFAWAKIAANATNIQTIWANKAGGWNTDGFSLYVNSYNTSDQRLIFEAGDGTTGQTLSSPSNAVSPAVWHSLAAVVNEPAGFAQLYVDGTSVASGQAVADFGNYADLNLGRFTNSTYYFDGSLDEARIANGACSSNWIAATWLNAASNSTFVTASAVNPATTLSYTQNGGAITLEWPSVDGVFTVYTSTSLGPTASWTPVSSSPTYANRQWQLAVRAPAQGNQFYRLQSR
jgi:hypothetical protein